MEFSFLKEQNKLQLYILWGDVDKDVAIIFSSCKKH